jgi:hypothetical protein
MHRKRYSAAAITFAALLAIVVAAVAGRYGVTRAEEQVTIPVGDIWFCDSSTKGGECDTDIYVGDTVTWDFSGASLPHTVTDCGDSCGTPTGSPRFGSGLVSDGSTFSYTFAQPGSYAYHCEVHPQQQMGRIIVHAGTRPATPTLVMISPPVDYVGTETPAATPTTGVEELPHSGQRPTGSATAWSALIALAMGGAALFVAGGALALRGKAPRE